VSEPAVHVSAPAPNVAMVTLDRPPVNALGRETRESLLRIFDKLEADNGVNVILLTAKGHVFCAGADIREKATEAGAESDYLRANRLTRDVFFTII
jgi:enoyl-CoA hydratase